MEHSSTFQQQNLFKLRRRSGRAIYVIGTYFYTMQHTTSFCTEQFQVEISAITNAVTQSTLVFACHGLPGAERIVIGPCKELQDNPVAVLGPPVGRLTIAVSILSKELAATTSCCYC